MRISKSQINSFIAAVEELGVHEFEIFLFGSRANDSAKGGDIDLMIIAKKNEIEVLKIKKPILLAKMKLKSEDYSALLMQFIRQLQIFHYSVLLLFLTMHPEYC